MSDQPLVVIVTDKTDQYALGFAMQQHDGRWTIHGFTNLVLNRQEDIVKALNFWRKVGEAQSLTDALALLRAIAAGHSAFWTPAGYGLLPPWTIVQDVSP